MFEAARLTQISEAAPEVRKTAILSRGFSMSPSSYRRLPGVRNAVPLESLCSTVFNGREIGSTSYTDTPTGFRFIRTNSIVEGALVRNALATWCKPQQGDHLKSGTILIAEDGGGDGLGEVGMYETSGQSKDFACNGALALQIKDRLKRHYVFGFLKSSYFKEYLDIVTPAASTIRHSNGAAKRFPIVNFDKTDADHALLAATVETWLAAERAIVKQNAGIDALIEAELDSLEVVSGEARKSHFVSNDFRMVASLYSSDYLTLRNRLEQYKHGHYLLGERFALKRGQNLQVSTIGTASYSKWQKPGYLPLVTTTETGDLRHIERVRYIASQKELALVPKGSVMLSADGTVGRAMWIPEALFVTNIHQWILQPIVADETHLESIWVACFLQYLRNKGYYDYIKDPANGGAIKEHHVRTLLPVPKVPQSLKRKIASLYFNEAQSSDAKPGIWQLSAMVFSCRKEVDALVRKIAGIAAEAVQG